MAMPRPHKMVGQHLWETLQRVQYWTMDLWVSKELPNLRRVLANLNLSGVDADKTGKHDGCAYLHHVVATSQDKAESFPEMREVTRPNDWLQPEDEDSLCAVAKDLRIMLEPEKGFLFVYCRHDKPDCFYLNLVRPDQRTRDRIGGPCPSCQKWFFRRTRKPSTYCSRKCAGNAAKIRQRHRQRQSRVERVKLAIRKFEALPPTHRDRHDWREFVIDRGYITAKFLTQLLNSHEITPPQNRDKHP